MTSTNIQDYDAMELRFDVVSQPFESIRHPEDGEVMVGDAFFVQAEAPDGVRWWREIGAADWVYVDAEDGGVMRTEEPSELMHKAIRLATKLENSPTRRLNPDVWHYAGACYGSSAYEALGIEEDTVYMERQEALG